MSNIPASMHAVEISTFGKPEVLKPCTRPTPQPKAGEVLVRVEAAAVNRPDVVQRQGNYPMPPGVSDLPGLDIAGRIAAVGEGVADWKVGDAVCALVAGGGYAQYCIAPAAQCLPIPKGLSAAEAASLPETFFTVWTNVFDRGGLKPGESILIQGGSSGIGVSAIQMAKALGHRVFATAGSDEKCAACLRLGADIAINYKTQDFAEVVKEATGGRGVNVILDMVGGSYVTKELRSLAVEGRLVFIAGLGGNKGEIPINTIMQNRLTITGSTLRPRPVEFKGEIARSLRAKIWPHIEAGKIKPEIYKTFPLDEAAKAHELMESSQHIGKIVLTVD